jgi:Uncharacterised nucleotidyltransferase
MAGRSLSFDALVAVVAAPEDASLPVSVDLDEVVELADRHRVSGALVRTLRASGRAVPDRLAAAHGRILADHLRVLRSLARLGEVLDDAAVDWLVVKGPVLATQWHRDPASRAYDDLDLLVDPRAFADAVVALEDAGYAHLNANWEGFRSLGVGEVPFDDGSTVIDLHWHLVGLSQHREAFGIRTDELMSRAVPVELGSVRARTLDAVDTLVHLCLHDAFAGARQLVQLKDLHIVASAVERDTAVERMRSVGVENLGAVVIDRSERLFGTIGGSSFAEHLATDGAWLEINRAVDRAWAAAGRSWTPFPGALPGAGRARRRDTVAALGSQVQHAVRPRLRLRSIVSEGGPLDWNAPTGGSVGRGAYLDEVATGRYGS